LLSSATTGPQGLPSSRAAARSFTLRALITPCALAAASLLAACSTAPKTPPEPPPPSYEQLLDQAAQAQKSGDTPHAVELWQSAAKRNPAAKEPWLRMAQTHFDSGDYGHAITEAEEALQRDNGDAVANGLLAVSGLRVSSQALARMHTEDLAGSTRGEAESLAKTLRTLLGTDVLVPQPDPDVEARAERYVHSRRGRPAAKKPADAAPATASAAAPSGTAPAVTTATASAAAKPAAKPATPAPSNDPFSSLR
jgi:tetratricopeptide (TPR) repeat protein